MFSRTSLTCIFSILAVAYAQPGNGMGMGTRGGNNKNKSVCETFQSAGGPAFGLCNAYCNAKKCNEESVPTTSCTNLKTQFMSITGGLLPCDTSAGTTAPTPEMSAPTLAVTSAPTTTMSDAPSATPVSYTVSDPPSLVPIVDVGDDASPTMSVLTASPTSEPLA